jgi:hypothetical protein
MKTPNYCQSSIFSRMTRSRVNNKISYNYNSLPNSRTNFLSRKITSSGYKPKSNSQDRTMLPPNLNPPPNSNHSKLKLAYSKNNSSKKTPTLLKPKTLSKPHKNPSNNNSTITFPPFKPLMDNYSPSKNKEINLCSLKTTNSKISAFTSRHSKSKSINLAKK